jgi:hypothetical protein
MIIAYLSLFTKVFKTNRKKLTIAVSNYVEQNNENEEVNIEKLNDALPRSSFNSKNYAKTSTKLLSIPEGVSARENL